MSSSAVVLVGGQEVRVSRERPFVFGRADDGEILGLDADDMGISADAGSIYWRWGLWWVSNRSRKCRILLDDGFGGVPQRLDCGHGYVISVPRLSVLVPGLKYTHRLEVVVPAAELARFHGERLSSGTLLGGVVSLTERDLDVVVALCSGYLEDFPRREARPRTYQEAADLLGAPWTKVSVRKQLERLKKRMAEDGTYFEGLHANYDLADHLISHGVLSPNDLARLPSRT